MELLSIAVYMFILMEKYAVSRVYQICLPAGDTSEDIERLLPKLSIRLDKRCHGPLRNTVKRPRSPVWDSHREAVVKLKA